MWSTELQHALVAVLVPPISGKPQISDIYVALKTHVAHVLNR